MFIALANLCKTTSARKTILTITAAWFLPITLLQAQTLNEKIAEAEKSGSDSVKVIALLKLAADNSKDYTSALAIVRKAQNYAQGQADNEAKCTRANGEIHKDNKKFETAIGFYEKSLKQFQRLNNTKQVSELYGRIGFCNRKLEKYEMALGYYSHSVEEAKKIKYTEQLKRAYFDWSLTYKQLGQSAKALEVLLDQLKFAEKEFPDDHDYLCNCNIRLAYHFYELSSWNESLKYSLEAARHAEITKNTRDLVDAYNTLGNVYKNFKQMDKAVGAMEKAVAASEGSNDAMFTGTLYINLGSLYYEMNQNKKGLEHKIKGLEYCRKVPSKYYMINACIAIGVDLTEKDKEYEKALPYLKEAEEASVSPDAETSLYMYSFLYQGLYKTYEGMNDYKNAYTYLDKFLTVRDSLLNSEKQKQINELETEYESEKKQQQITLLNRNQRIQELQLIQQRSALEKQLAENKINEGSILLLEKEKALKEFLIRKKENETKTQKERIALLGREKRLTNDVLNSQRNTIYAFIGASVLLFSLLFLVYRGYANKKKTNAEILKQKMLIEEHSREVTNSINYAKRLQEAMLPRTHFIAELFSDSFVMFKPKDIVSGDFFWVEKIDNFTFFAVADCTGHGVPGAMVSVVGASSLNRCVQEFGLRDPGKILDKLTSLIVEVFEKSDDEVKDGMDISLCRFNHTTYELVYAGANNPLWIVKNDELQEIRADKQPIGKFDHMKPFTSHYVKLEQGQQVYIFSDGFADQFGGEKGKKFKYSQLKQLFVTVKTRSMKERLQTLEQTFEKWKGELEQVDDVCILGIQI